MRRGTIGASDGSAGIDMEPRVGYLGEVAHKLKTRYGDRQSCKTPSRSTIPPQALAIIQLGFFSFNDKFEARMEFLASAEGSEVVFLNPTA